MRQLQHGSETKSEKKVARGIPPTCVLNEQTETKSGIPSFFYFDFGRVLFDTAWGWLWFLWEVRVITG
jgi:hypothetical protein